MHETECDRRFSLPPGDRRISRAFGPRFASPYKVVTTASAWSRRQGPGHDSKCRAYPSRQEVSEPTSSKVFVLRKVSTSCCIAATDRDFICHRAPPTLTCNWCPRGSCQSCIESLSYLYLRLEYSYLQKLGLHHHSDLYRTGRARGFAPRWPIRILGNPKPRINMRERKRLFDVKVIELLLL